MLQPSSKTQLRLRRHEPSWIHLRKTNRQEVIQKLMMHLGLSFKQELNPNFESNSNTQT